MKYRMFGFDPVSPLHNSRHRENNHDRNSSNHSLAPGDEGRPSTTEMSRSTNDVNRNTSVRSVMTLPPYNAAPLPSERLIAREGERAGVDTVVEFPETAEEEEARRNEDMEALYQIRLTRRRENEEREERRRERRAAREAGDWARVEQLRLQAQMRARARAESVGSAGSSSTSLPRDSNAMLAEHQSRASSRDGRVGSVSYAELGLARHDGSRLRTDSVESDHRPLLDSAASMGGQRSRRGSLFQVPSNLSSVHQRNASTGSVLSNESEGGPMDTPYTSNRSGSDPPMLTPSATQGSNGSEHGNEHPAEAPPQYEDEEAPPYTSPLQTDAPQLPQLSPVPAIEVEGATPANSIPPTPVDSHDRH